MQNSSLPPLQKRPRRGTGTAFDLFETRLRRGTGTNRGSDDARMTFCRHMFPTKTGRTYLLCHCLVCVFWFPADLVGRCEGRTVYFAAARPRAGFRHYAWAMPVRLMAPSYFTPDASVSFFLQPPFLTNTRPPTKSFAGNSGATVEILPSSSRSLQLQLAKSAS